MTTAFKHISKPGESRFESLGEATTLYRWENLSTSKVTKAEWREKMWSFEVFATTTDGVHATGFLVRLKECFIGNIVLERAELFDDLDKASHFVNDQVGQRMSWGYRANREPEPTE